MSAHDQTDEMIEEVLRLARGTGPIPKARLLELWETGNLSVRAMIYSSVLASRGVPERVVPMLSLGEAAPWLLQYFERCIKEDRDDGLADSRFTALSALSCWLADWGAHDPPKDSCRRAAEWLGELYRAADSSLRDTIITATLEHCLGLPGVRKAFAAWENDPTLRPAYEEGVKLSGIGTLASMMPWNHHKKN